MTAPLKADVTAADRLLKAAVRRAVETLQTDLRPVVVRHLGEACFEWRNRTDAEVEDARYRVADLLATATHAADLLLADDERPAKKAAARKGAS